MGNKAFVDIYREKPKSYIMVGESGFGKSTQLKHFRNKILGKKLEVNGDTRTIIPIYIRMCELNKTWDIDNYFFQNTFLKRYFPDASKEQLVNLFNDKQYEYVFILDGINELVDRVNSNQERLFDLLYNSIYMLSRHETVQFIISTTSFGDNADINILGHSINSDEIFDNFEEYFLRGLTDTEISSYLGVVDIHKEDYTFLENPMFLRMFKDLFDAGTGLDAINTKSKVLQKALKVQVLDKRQLDLYKDVNYEDLCQLYFRIMPFLAYHIVFSLLSQQPGQIDSVENLLIEYCEKNYDYNSNEKRVFIEKNKILIKNQRVFDIERMMFLHQYYQEHFCSIAFCSDDIIDEYSKVAFINAITEQLRYRNNQADLVRRTRFLGVAESIVSEVDDKLLKYVCDKDAVQSFYQELAGVYEDIKGDLYGKASSKWGWVSYKLLIEKNSMSYDILLKKNFLFYCIIKDVNSTMDYNGINYHVEDILNELNEYVSKYEPVNKKDRDLHARILNNIGAYYYAKKEYKDALLWHKKSLDFRLKYKMGIINSCRCVMGDLYHMNKAKPDIDLLTKAYHYYRLGINELINGEPINIDLVYSEYDIPVDYAARGLGIISQLIISGDKKELVDEAISICRYVAEQSTKYRRIDRYNLENIYSEINRILEIEFEGREKLMGIRDSISNYI